MRNGAAVLCAGALAAACGGDLDTSQPRCGGFAACGGDVAGRWSLAGACAAGGPMPVDGCPGGSIQVTLEMTGTMVLGADRGYSVHGSGAGAVRLTVPAVCGGSTCGDLQEALQREARSGETVRCAGTMICNCTLSAPAAPFSERGTWDVDGTALALVPAGGRRESYDRCVSGDELRLQARLPALGGVRVPRLGEALLGRPTEEVAVTYLFTR